ncbi:MAG: DNA methyltransferase [Candidatus Saccharimonadales bacterium]
MYIAILGRQPAISIAELERLYGGVSWFSDTTATVEADRINVQNLGGTQKIGQVIAQLPNGDWRKASMKIVTHYAKEWAKYEGKITLGISAYGFEDTDIRDIQKTGLILKTKLKATTASLRLIPNQESALSTATSHHNKLGLSDNKIELLVVRGRRGIIIAESRGAQNITALAARDQGRPKRDAFVGMLPPKLAQIMINLANLEKGRILDPFCGTGVILQEALLMGYDVFGSDLSEKMVSYTQANITWLAEQNPHAVKGLAAEYAVGDAATTIWKSLESGTSKDLVIDAVVAETYLGQPFSAPPSSGKLTEVRGNCNHIISLFLKNIGAQLKSGTPLVLAVPAWRDTEGRFTHLPFINALEKLGYQQVEFNTVNSEQLLYFRPDQVVARELLVLTKI